MKYKHGLCIVSLVLLSAGTLLGQGFDSDSGEGGESGFSPPPPYSGSSGSSGSSSSGSGSSSSGSSSSGSSGSFIDPPSNSNPPSGGSPPASTPNTPNTPTPQTSDPYLIDPPQTVIDFVHQVATEYASRLTNGLWMQAIIGDYDATAAENIAEGWAHLDFTGLPGILPFPTIYLLDPAVTYLEENGQRVKDSEGYTYNAFANQYYDVNGNVVAYTSLPDVQLQGAYSGTNNIIYLSQDLFAAGSDPLAARDVVIQELAHYIDFAFSIGWGQEDHTGSEGILASMCFDELYRFFYDDTIDTSQQYTDHATLFWTGSTGVQVELGFKKKLKRLKHKLSHAARDAAQQINHAGHTLVRAGAEVVQVYEDAILAEYGEAAHLFDEARDFYNAHSQAIEMAGMIGLLLLSGPELVAGFGTDTPLVIGEDIELVMAMEALMNAPESVDAAVMAADAVETANAIGDTASMAEASIDAVQAATEANAAYAEGASELAEASGQNIDFFLQTIEDFGDGNTQLIDDHISMISDEADAIEEASHSAQSSYLAAEQNLDAAEAAEAAGTMTPEELEVVEDALQEAADEAAEATSEAAQANAAEAQANRELAEEYMDQFEDNGCGGVAFDTKSQSKELLAWMNILRKIKETTFMSVARIMGVMPVSATGICEGYLADVDDAMSEAGDSLSAMENNIQELNEIATNNPGPTTYRELQEAQADAARAYMEQADMIDFWGLGASPEDSYIGSVNCATDAIQSGFDSVTEARNAIFNLENEDLNGIENYDRMMSVTNHFTQMWDTYDTSNEMSVMSNEFVEGLPRGTQEEIDFATAISDEVQQGNAMLSETEAIVFDNDTNINSVCGVLDNAVDAADAAGDMERFLEASSRNMVLVDILNAGEVGTTTADSLAADLIEAIEASDNLDLAMLEDGTVDAGLATDLLGAAEEALNTDLIRFAPELGDAMSDISELTESATSEASL
ncbi:MAG: hypothetical protein AAF984_03660 [Verrucomicrobiota bacterium]